MRLSRMDEKEDPDNVERQAEVARRLMAYAAELRSEAGTDEAPDGEARQ